MGALCWGGASWPKIAPGYWSLGVWRQDLKGFGEQWKCTPMEACLGDDGFGSPVCAFGYEQGVSPPHLGRYLAQSSICTGSIPEMEIYYIDKTLL